jgi:DNA modification methylase
METTHRVHAADARDLALPEESVDLVVTSPPYPMVEMWDDTFGELAPEAETALAAGDGEAAFEAMHGVLDAVWDELARVLRPGGIACVNVGDATRTLERFRVYPNHSRVGDALRERGLELLPEVLWRKPANSAAKFMGSGMVPPNAYVTLEHEYVLVARNGDRRSFEPGSERRYESAYFWEERNRWFSDTWEVRGRRQDREGSDPAGDGTDLPAATRERAGAFPFEIPYRLVNMYSVYGDTVLDPFWGTGTTTLAAMVAGRNSVGYERDGSFLDAFADRVAGVPARSRAVLDERLAAHREFAAERDLGYEAVNYEFPVRTKQERDVQFYEVTDVRGGDGGHEAGRTTGADATYRVAYDPR